MARDPSHDSSALSHLTWFSIPLCMAIGPHLRIDPSVRKSPNAICPGC